MTLWCGSQRGLASSQVLIAVAWFIFAALSVQCQSSPAAQVADCPTADDQAAAPGGEANDSIAAVRPEIQRVGRSSFPELVHIHLRVRAFRSQSDYFRTRFSWSRFLLLMRMRYFVDVIRCHLRDCGSRACACCLPKPRKSHPTPRLDPLDIRAVHSEVRTWGRSGSDPSRLRERSESISHLGLQPYPARQASAKTADLFYSERNHSYPDEIAGAA